MSFEIIKKFIVGLVLFVGADFLWFKFVAAKLFHTQLGNLLLKSESGLDVRFVSAALVYLLIIFGIIYFVLPRAYRPVDALIAGAIFGFVIYGVYELTNYSVLKDWTTSLVLADMMWGTILTATVAFLMRIFRL